MGSHQPEVLISVTELSLLNALREHVESLEEAGNVDGVLSSFDEWLDKKRNSINAEAVGVDSDSLSVKVTEDAIMNSSSFPSLLARVINTADQETWDKWTAGRMGMRNQDGMMIKSELDEEFCLPDYGKTIDDVLTKIRAHGAGAMEEDEYPSEQENSEDLAFKSSTVLKNIVSRVKRAKAMRGNRMHRDGLECRSCGKTCSDDRELIEHEAQCYDNMCEECGKTYKSRKSLLYHQKVHTGEGFPCELCPKVFPRKEYLKDHMRSHTGETPYKCSECPLAFKSRSHRTKHIRTKHTFEKPYTCKVCNKGFAALYMLKSHFVSHTQEKKYRCEVCNQTFGLVENIRRHMKIVHAKIREHECQLCKKAFQFKYILSKHLEDIHGIKPGDTITTTTKDKLTSPSRNLPIMLQSIVNNRANSPRILSSSKKSGGTVGNVPMTLSQDGKVILETMNDDGDMTKQALYLIQLPDGQLHLSTEETESGTLLLNPQ